MEPPDEHLTLAPLAQPRSTRASPQACAPHPPHRKLRLVVVKTVAIAIVIALWLVVARGGLSGARFTITIHDDGPAGVRIRGTIPAHATSDVVAFVAALGLPHGARLQGIPSNGRIELRFSPSVPAHLHQRLRNFFSIVAR